MKILAIGDAHGNLREIEKAPAKDVDLILLNGDLGKANLMRKMAFANANRVKQGLPKLEYSPSERKKAFMEAYDSSLVLVRYLSGFAPVYLIFGNVESSNAETRKESKEIGLALPFLRDNLEKIKGVRIINNRVANFGGIRIGGLEYFVDESWVRKFRPGDYGERLRNAMIESKKAKRVLRNFGQVDILLCHQPPLGVLDKVTARFAPKPWQGKHAGSKVIFDYVRREQPGYVFCGHIHEARGHAKIGASEVYNLGDAGYKMIEIN